MDILRMLDDLWVLIDETPTFGPISWQLNRDELSMQINKIKASVPQEMKTAVNMVRESERPRKTLR